MLRPRHLIALPLALLAGAFAAPAGAATFTVGSFVDSSDASPGNGTCATGAGVCTLRAAVQEAGSLAGPDTITLPAGTYQLLSGLGALSITSSVTINGAGARTTTVRAANGSRVFSINATSTLRDLTITGGSLTSTTALYGGGVRITGGDVTLERTTVRGNSVSSSQLAFGGGIGVESTEASVTVIDSTITGNSAYGGSGADNGGSAAGGGIYTSGPGIIKRSTVAANTATGGPALYAQGGGAYISGNATIEQSTFAANGVATIGDVTGFRQGGNLLIADNSAISGSIFAAGTATSGPDCYRQSGSVTEPAKNLASSATDCLGAGSLRGVDPKLGSLTDNGGPTDTMRPAADSPAIDAAASCGSRTADQRGNALFGGTGCDLGAVEVAASRTVTLQSSKASAAAGEDITLIAKLDNAGFDTATGEVLAIELPAGVTPTTATTTAGSCSVAATVTCALGSVPRGTAITAIVTARASGATFSITARRSGGVPDQNTGDDAATVQITGVGAAALSGSGAPGTPGAPGAGTPDSSAPVISGIALSKRPRPSLRKGAALAFSLSEAATVQVTVERLRSGRRAGGVCRTTPGAKGKRCQQAVKVTSFTRQLAAGSQSLALTRTQLRAGAIRITLVAIDAAGNRSPAASTQGTVRR